MDRQDKVRLKTSWSKLEKRAGAGEGSTTCASHSLPLKAASLLNVKRKLQDYLVKKYGVSSKLYYLKVVDTLVKGSRDPGVIRLKYDLDVTSSTKTLKRYYQLDESVTRIEQMSEYFKYHYEIPRLFLPGVVDVIDSFHDRKRNKIYQQVKRLIGKENIVGDDSEPETSSLDQQAKHKGGYGFIFVGNELEKLRDGFDIENILDIKNETLKILLTKLSYKSARTSKNQRTPSMSELSMSGLSKVLENQVKDFRAFISSAAQTNSSSPKRGTERPKIQISHRLTEKLSEITQSGSAIGQTLKPTLRVNISPRLNLQSSLQQDSALKSPSRMLKQTKPSLLIAENTTNLGRSRVNQPSLVELTSQRESKPTQKMFGRKSQLGLGTSGSGVAIQIGGKKASTEWLNKGWFKTLSNDHRAPKSPSRLPGAQIESELSQKSTINQFKKEIDEFHLFQSSVKESNNPHRNLTSSFKDLRGLSNLPNSAKSFSPTINIVRSSRLGKSSFNLLNLELASQKPEGQKIPIKRFKTQGSQGYIKEGSYQIDAGLYSPKVAKENLQSLGRTGYFDSKIAGFSESSQRIHTIQKQKKAGSVVVTQPSLQSRFEQRARVSLTTMMNSQSPRDIILVKRMKSEDKGVSGSMGRDSELQVGQRVLHASILSNLVQPSLIQAGMKQPTSPSRSNHFIVQQLPSSPKHVHPDTPLKLKPSSHRHSSSTSKGLLASAAPTGHTSHKSNAARVGQQSYKSPANPLMSLLPDSAITKPKLTAALKVRNY